MRFYHTNIPFDIPCDWWLKAGMAEFRPRAPQYRPRPCALDGQRNKTVCVVSVRVVEVEPLRCLKRSHGVFNDHPGGPTAEERVLKILRGFVANSAIPPVEVERQPEGSDFPYKLRHGAHRFYCSVAAGFSRVPAVEVPPDGFFSNSISLIAC